MEAHKRYKIDVSDERHLVVLLNADRPTRDLVAAVPAILVKLLEWQAGQRRAAIAPVAELSGDEGLARAATGTDDGASDLAARQARRTFGVVRGGR